MTSTPTVEHPEITSERRRIEYAPYRTHAYDDHAHDPSAGPALRLVLVIAGAIGFIAALGSALAGAWPA